MRLPRKRNEGHGPGSKEVATAVSTPNPVPALSRRSEVRPDAGRLYSTKTLLRHTRKMRGNGSVKQKAMKGERGRRSQARRGSSER